MASASHALLSLSFPPNCNPRNVSPFSSVQNPNAKTYPSPSLFINFVHFRSSISKFSSSKASSINSSLITGPTDPQLSTTPTLRELCQGHVPEHVLSRMDEIGFVTPTAVQQQGLPVLFSGCDCLLHAQSSILKSLQFKHWLWCQQGNLACKVTKVARMLAAKPTDIGPELQKTCTVMALLDGGMLKRHRTWLKADPPAIVVATVASLCQMLEKRVLDLNTMRVLVIDEVDFMFNSPSQVASLRKLLTSYSSNHSRQTVLASASIPQRRHFLHDCVQQKWTKSNIVHVHVNPVEPMPSCLHHRFVVCPKNQKNQALLSLLRLDLPESAILFVNEQSEKSKKAGDVPTTTLLVDFLKGSYEEFSSISLLEEDMNFNSRATSLLEIRKRSCYLLVATDLAARGVDLPETTHIYNFDLPKSAVHYLHRAGRTGRKPFSDGKCVVTSIIAPEEHFVLHRFENELKFRSEQLFL